MNSVPVPLNSLHFASLTDIECRIRPIYCESYKYFLIVPTWRAWNLSFYFLFFPIVVYISTFCYNQSLFRTSKYRLSKMCVKGKIERILRTRLHRCLWGTARINLFSIIILGRRRRLYSQNTHYLCICSYEDSFTLLLVFIWNTQVWNHRDP